MALWHWLCPNCGSKTRKILDINPPDALKCPCGSEQVLQTTGPTVQIKEVLDNGYMVKKVERWPDIDEIRAKRSKDHK